MGVNASSYPHSCSPRFGGNPQTQQTFIGKLALNAIIETFVVPSLATIVIDNNRKVRNGKIYYIFLEFQMAYMRTKFSGSHCNMMFFLLQEKEISLKDRSSSVIRI